MNSKLTIVMYHYVRDLANSAFPRIKGLDTAAFRRQLDFLQSEYTFISHADLVACIKAANTLPEHACWLTFDDGYRDHYENVFPELTSRGISGAFFPPVSPVVEREMLDVNKIHFVLASSDDVSVLVAELRKLYRDHNLSVAMDKSFDECWAAYAHPSRFDSAAVIFVKRMLQFLLPEDSRSAFADILFKKYVSADILAFADALYMSEHQLSEMVAAGMYVGSHGNRHLWLGKESPQTQRAEISRSLAFLQKVGAPTVDWVMCYPYGNYNSQTHEILEDEHCLAGLATEVGIADLRKHARLELPRMDTNDFPQ
jgi:peptidoglycan/xylan/chitin deacetylase (PgdA/CDA1 family)